ncbi:hypothetical protein R1flu_026789 [Riccia fluitans]|uniref:Uncharacterized protein n=1 Tax=Riccia fluitans TaxID=41844 RepID=A0ABD1XJX8_9MARC
MPLRRCLSWTGAASFHAPPLPPRHFTLHSPPSLSQKSLSTTAHLNLSSLRLSSFIHSCQSLVRSPQRPETDLLDSISGRDSRLMKSEKTKFISPSIRNRDSMEANEILSKARRDFMKLYLSSRAV